MALTNKNNLLVYYGTLASIGDEDDTTSAAGIVSGYDSLIIGRHTGADLVNLTEILMMAKRIKPTLKVFGLTAVTVDVLTWQLDVDGWILDLPAGLLDGFYVADFGFESRVIQNDVVTYIHSVNRSVFAHSEKLGHVFETVGIDDVPLIGTSTTIKDYVMMDQFFYIWDPARPQTAILEAKAHVEARLRYATAILGKVPKVNVSFAASVSVGRMLRLTDAEYAEVIRLLNVSKVDSLALTPFDYGMTSHRYYVKNQANDFTVGLSGS